MRNNARSALIVGLVLLTLSLSTQPHYSYRVPEVFGATHNIFLNGESPGGWNATSSNPNPTITVTEMDSVAITLDSTDGFSHQLYIDADRSYPSIQCTGLDKCSAIFPPQSTYLFPVDFPAGTYAYYCSLHPFTMVGTFEVRGFTLASNPKNLTIIRGSSANSTLTLTSFNGFAGTANLAGSSNPAGPNLSFNPSSVSLGAGGSATSNVTVSVPSSTPAGLYSLTVNATIGSITHTSKITLNVKAPGFSLSPTPPQLIMLQGSSKTTNITVTSLNSFNGPVALSANSSIGISTVFSPPTVPLTGGGSAVSILNVTVTTFVPSGVYNLNLIGASSSAVNSTILKLTVGPDFMIDASPANLTIPQGSSRTSTITMVSVNGFMGNVSLSSTGNPTGLTISFSTAWVNLSSGGTGSTSVIVSASQSAAPSTYDVTVTGTNYTRVHTLNLKITLSGFTIQTSRVSLNITQGSTRSSIITLASINGFSGTMSLTVTGSSALTPSITPLSAPLNANENLTATLSFSANATSGLTPPGSYVFNVTGTVGSLSHSTTVNVTVTALTPAPAPGTPSAALVAGAVVSLTALLSLILFLAKRRRTKGRSLSVPEST